MEQMIKNAENMSDNDLAELIRRLNLVAFDRKTKREQEQEQAEAKVVRGIFAQYDNLELFNMDQTEIDNLTKHVATSANVWKYEPRLKMRMDNILQTQKELYYKYKKLSWEEYYKLPEDMRDHIKRISELLSSRNNPSATNKLQGLILGFDLAYHKSLNPVQHASTGKMAGGAKRASNSKTKRASNTKPKRASNTKPKRASNTKPKRASNPKTKRASKNKK